MSVQAFAASNIGKVRKSNQDSGYSGYNFFFVADGMGGHAGGDIASAMVSQAVAGADQLYSTPLEAIKGVDAALVAANEKLTRTVADHQELRGMGTTFSGIMLVDDKIALSHIGDSRIYRVTDGKLKQVSKDHTFVQRLVDTGRITEEEALVHPRRNVLMRVLGDVEIELEIDSEIHDAVPGDRWLLCSDGLSGVVPEDVISRIMLNKTVDVEEAAELLVYEALEHGAPDNVTVVIVDVLSPGVQSATAPSAKFVGSAENDVVIAEHKGRSIVEIFNPRIIRDLLTRQPADAEFAVESEELLEKILNETRSKVRWRKIRSATLVLILISFVVILLNSLYNYTQTRYYIGEKDGYVAIFKGIREAFGPLRFSTLYERTSTLITELNPYQKQLVERTISGDSLLDILTKLKTLLKLGG
ncbi:MAG: PP2C family protein-serine/threonine phosphatase [Micrococcales bacterium]